MKEPFRKRDGNFLAIDSWEQAEPSLKAGFTMRTGGHSYSPFDTFNQGLHVGDEDTHVLANRNQLATAINQPLESWIAGQQIHGTRVQQVGQSDQGRGALEKDTALAGIDGLFTNTSGVLCTGFFADCVPLFFFDPVSFRVGIAHAGWKGTVNNIAGAMIDHFVASGSRRQDIQVVIGPAISGDVYEVDHRVISAVGEEYVDQTVTKTKDGHGLLDLKQLNMKILLKWGVLRHNIGITRYCTFSDENLFFSHRRDHGQTGRMLGYIGFSI